MPRRAALTPSLLAPERQWRGGLPCHAGILPENVYARRVSSAPSGMEGGRYAPDGIGEDRIPVQLPVQLPVNSRICQKNSMSQFPYASNWAGLLVVVG
jgi:hypothetical protein